MLPMPPSGYAAWLILIWVVVMARNTIDHSHQIKPKLLMHLIGVFSKHWLVWDAIKYIPVCLFLNDGDVV